MNAPRIIITGSRDWADRARISRALRHACQQLGYVTPAGIVLVSGACPTGADAICEDIWSQFGAPIERHPANWDQHGKRAGYIRNAEMVNAGADLCLAFISNGSRGATMTADLAEKAGIRTVRHCT